jgi:hypothetical protein
MRRLVADYPLEAEYRCYLAAALTSRAATALDTRATLLGVLDAAERDMREGVEVLQPLRDRPSDHRLYRYTLESLHSMLAQVLTVRGRLDEAAAELERVLGLRRQMAAEKPNDRPVQYGLADSLHGYGKCLTEMKRT